MMLLQLLVEGMLKILLADECELAHYVLHRGKVTELTDKTSKACAAVIFF